MSILVTGGLGYIGSHTCIELLKNNEEVVIIDNLSNSEYETLDRIKEISKKDVAFYYADLLDKEKLSEIFNENSFSAVIHFAGLKSVNESVKHPLEYYNNNIVSTLNLCEVMKNHHVKNIIFSSSATVYGHPAKLPITEDFPLSTTNPYGTSKLMIEEILQDLFRSDNEWSIFLLRYFNPIGAHNSGLLGEKPNGIPNNLLPYVSKVASGELSKLHIFGNDYITPDGTAIRDFIHVVDLAKGHLKSLEKSKNDKGVHIYNLGTGKGHSVLEIVKTYEKVSGINIPFIFDERREGDVPVCYADPTKAKNELGWSAEKNIEEMCYDSWKWTEKNK